MKKFQIHLDAVIVIAILFMVLLAGNWYQNRQYDELFIQKVDLEWRLQNAESSLIQFQQKFDHCAQQNSDH